MGAQDVRVYPESIEAGFVGAPSTSHRGRTVDYDVLHPVSVRCTSWARANPNKLMDETVDVRGSWQNDFSVKR
ncbi:hypothetical protein FRC09_012711, partial [Ceratobasidium sp. 395]